MSKLVPQSRRPVPGYNVGNVDKEVLAVEDGRLTNYNQYHQRNNMTPHKQDTPQTNPSTHWFLGNTGSTRIPRFFLPSDALSPQKYESNQIISYHTSTIIHFRSQTTLLLCIALPCLAACIHSSLNSFMDLLVHSFTHEIKSFHPQGVPVSG